MNLKDLFKQTKEISELLNGELLEISVRQHQVTISVKEPMLSLPYVKEILNSAKNSSDSFVSTKNDVLYFTIGGLSKKIGKKNIFYPFIDIITSFADNICACPSLEFIISNQYMKCFLDKPGLKRGFREETKESLMDYEDILEAEGKGELELHPQRPYLLFINEDYKE